MTALLVFAAIISLGAATTDPNAIQTVLDKVAEIESAKSLVEQQLDTLKQASRSMIQAGLEKDANLINLIQVPESMQQYVQAPKLKAVNAVQPIQMLASKPAPPAPAAKPLAPNAMKIYAQMAVYHTDMMALMYVFSFFLSAQKLAVDGGGYVKPDPEEVKAAAKKEEKKSLSLERIHNHHSRNSHQKINMEEVSFLQTGAGEKSISTTLHIQAIYFDVLANYHICMASLYSMPGAIAGLKSPSYKSYMTYARVMAFWYWGGVQYYVDLVDIYALSGASMDTKQYDAFALRVKDYAFTMWMIENYLTLMQIGAPTAKNALSFLLTLDNMKLVELAKTCIYIGYMGEGKIKAAAELGKMIPALGLQFAYTAFHGDLIARMIG